jgi:hypothetical protein
VNDLLALVKLSFWALQQRMSASIKIDFKVDHTRATTISPERIGLEDPLHQILCSEQMICRPNKTHKYQSLPQNIQTIANLPSFETLPIALSIAITSPAVTFSCFRASENKDKWMQRIPFIVRRLKTYRSFWSRGHKQSPSRWF